MDSISPLESAADGYAHNLKIMVMKWYAPVERNTDKLAQIGLMPVKPRVRHPGERQGIWKPRCTCHEKLWVSAGPTSIRCHRHHANGSRVESRLRGPPHGVCFRSPTSFTIQTRMDDSALDRGTRRDIDGRWIADPTRFSGGHMARYEMSGLCVS